MNLERGFRRLVLTISVAGVAVGLGVTGSGIYGTIQWVTATNNRVACMEKAPTVEEFRRLPDFYKPEGKKLEDVDALKEWTEAVRSHRFLEGCKFPRRNDVPRSVFRGISRGNFENSQSYSLVMLPLILGLSFTACLGAIPWGVFYLVRWIVQGFIE